VSYLGNSPVNGDNTFRILDDISSYTLTFDGSSAGVVSVANNTFTFYNHRFITGQKVTYNNGGGAIGNLGDGQTYYIIKNDQNTIKVASSYGDAINNIPIDITALASTLVHSFTVAFDGFNTKFKATYLNGTKALITRAAQLQISINGVIQQPFDTSSPASGFGIDLDSVIVFSVAPQVTDAFWGNVIATSFPTFDIADNTVDNFTGNGVLTNFTLSKTPANSQNVLVTIDGVVQYPSEAGTVRSYSVQDNILVFSDAPGNGTEIEVRHIGFAGATSSNVTGFYGRTGNVGLTTADNVNVGNVNAGVVSATSFVGDGTNITGVSGFATALSSTQGSLLNTIFKTTQSFTVGSGTSVTIQSDDTSGNIAFTRLNNIIVSTGATVRVATGTTFIMNALNVF
jgi:hypothetical protein